MLWLVGVFFILNFTIGGGLFIALVGFSKSKSSNDTGRYMYCFLFHSSLHVTIYSSLVHTIKLIIVRRRVKETTGFRKPRALGL